MYKRLRLALLVGMLLASLLTGVASAEEEIAQKFAHDGGPHRRFLVGQVTALIDDQFELEALNGNSFTILVTGETVFHDRRGEEEVDAGFDDLETGMWVGIRNRRDAEGQVFAGLVVFLTKDFDPTEFEGVHAAGEVDKINNGQGNFAVITRAGDEMTFSVDEETRFAGGISDFEDLEKGLMVAVLARQQSDGSVLAKLVGSRKFDRPPKAKFGGKISELGASSLTIVTRAGDEMTFSVTDETRYGSRTGEVNGIEDLEIDMAVVVVTRPVAHDEALGILVLDLALLKLERVRGEVQSAGGSHLTLIVDGEKIDFTVDENTRIKGRGIDDLNDIKNGMTAGVLYLVKEDGTFLAKGILVWGGNQ